MKYTKDEFIKKYGVPDNKLEDYPSATFYPMKTRTEVLQHLIDKYNLQSYCELGTQVRALNFDRIRCKQKFCVDIDPNAKADFTGSTDDFFKQLNRNYDLYFIDASHYADDVRMDFENCLKHSNTNTFICLHDCNPLKEEHTIVPRQTKTGHWNGDVYKFASKLAYHANYLTVNVDNGCGIWKSGGSYVYPSFHPDVTWSDFYANRKELLNLISWDEFVNL